MLPTSNGSFKANSKVNALDEDRYVRPAFASTQHKLENTNVALPISDDLVVPTDDVVRKSLIYKLFMKEKDAKDKIQPSIELKKPQGSKQKRFEIVRMICFYLQASF
jgi:hypothetical protein